MKRSYASPRNKISNSKGIFIRIYKVFQFSEERNRKRQPTEATVFIVSALLLQTCFFVISEGTWMDRCGQAFQHVLFGQATVSRMKFLELLEVFENFFDDSVYHVTRNLGRGHESGFDAECLDIFIVRGCRIEFGYLGDGFGIVGVFFKQTFDVGNRNEFHLAPSGGGLIVIRAGMADGVESGIEPAVLD